MLDCGSEFHSNISTIDGNDWQLGYARQPFNAAGIEGIPLELQIRGYLRLVGRSTCFDGIEVITKGSAENSRQKGLFVVRRKM